MRPVTFKVSFQAQFGTRLKLLEASSSSQLGVVAVLREATKRLFSDVQGVPNWHIESAVKKIPSPFSSCEFCLTDFQPLLAAQASKASSHKPEKCGTEAML